MLSCKAFGPSLRQRQQDRLLAGQRTGRTGTISARPRDGLGRVAGRVDGATARRRGGCRQRDATISLVPAAGR